MYRDFFWHCLNLDVYGEREINLKKNVRYSKIIQLVTPLLGSVGIHIDKRLLICILIYKDRT